MSQRVKKPQRIIPVWQVVLEDITRLRIMYAGFLPSFLTRSCLLCKDQRPETDLREAVMSIRRVIANHLRTPDPSYNVLANILDYTKVMTRSSCSAACFDHPKGSTPSRFALSFQVPIRAYVSVRPCTGTKTKPFNIQDWGD